MAMSDETKARLKTYADAKKGLKNLKSLDPTRGLVGLDHVMDRYEDNALPQVQLFANGALEYRVAVPDGHAPWVDAMKLAPGSGFERPAWVPCMRVKGERPHGARCEWVRLKHAADWQREEFAKRWPSRRVAVRSYQGPTRGNVWNTETLHPLNAVVAWLRFIWPERLEWGARADKYLAGYTNRYIHDFPGVGAKVRVLKFGGPSIYAPGTPDHTKTDGVVTESPADRFPWFAVQVPDHGVPYMMGNKSDEWEILPL